jgi:hypothetical protein
MTLLEQDLLKRLQNCDVFGDQNRAAFAPTSRALPLFDELKSITASLQAEQSKQGASSGGAIGSTRAKSAILAELWRDEGKIDGTAKQMTTLSAQEKGYFVRPATTRETGVVAAARAFIEKGTPLWAKFVAYEMDADLLTDMAADLAEYDAAYAAQQGDTQGRIGAGVDIDALIERGNDITEELRPIVKNKFDGQAGILAAWTSAVRYPGRDKTKKVAPVPPVP